LNFNNFLLDSFVDQPTLRYNLSACEIKAERN